MIKWSFSGLKDFVNCPKQYNEVKVLRNFTKKVTQQMLYGTEVHKALEDYTQDGTELPAFYKKYQPMLDALMEGGGVPNSRTQNHFTLTTQNSLRNADGKKKSTSALYMSWLRQSFKRVLCGGSLRLWHMAVVPQVGHCALNLSPIPFQ